MEKIPKLGELVTEDNLEAINTTANVLKSFTEFEVKVFSFMLTEQHFEYAVEDTLMFVLKNNTSTEYIKKCAEATNKMI